MPIRKMKAVLFGTFVLLCLCLNPALSQHLRAGAAVRIITPEPLLPVSGGIGTPRASTEKKGDLTVRALVLEKGNIRVAIVGVDNLGWSSALGDRSRALIREIAPENILIGATHTHSAPDAYGFPDDQGKSKADLQYLDRCVRQIADAVNEAIRNLQPASLSNRHRLRLRSVKQMEKSPITIMRRSSMIRDAA
jgi:predicted neutral ceramidase superfamily lipid hydrolase